MLSAHVPDLTALEVLMAVQQAGSLRAAAAIVGTSQQAVSLRVRSIERQVGVPLVQRGAHGSVLTDQGRLVTEWAGRVLAAAAALDAGIASLRSDRSAQLRVAASLTIAEQLLPSWLLSLTEEQRTAGQATTGIQLEVTNSEQVAQLVRSGHSQLGFVEGPRPPVGLRHRVVAHDELLVVVGRTHPWARRRRPISAEELAGTPLVAREPGSGTRRAFERAVARRLPDGELAAPVMELANSTALRATIASGLAPGVMSALAAREDLPTGRLIAVATDLDLRRALRAVWSGDAQPPAGPVRDLVRIAASR